MPTTARVFGVTSPRPPRRYRALQVYAALAPQVAYLTTIYGLSRHLGVEVWPVSAWLFSLTGGYLLDEALRLLITASVIGQSVYAWRLFARTGDRRSLATGWFGLGLWSLLVTLDGLWDTIGLLVYLSHH